MQITDVQTNLLTWPCTLDPYLPQARRVRSAAFVERLLKGHAHSNEFTPAQLAWNGGMG